MSEEIVSLLVGTDKPDISLKKRTWDFVIRRTPIYIRHSRAIILRQGWLHLTRIIVFTCHKEAIVSNEERHITLRICAAKSGTFLHVLDHALIGEISRLDTPS